MKIIKKTQKNFKIKNKYKKLLNYLKNIFKMQFQPTMKDIDQS